MIRFYTAGKRKHILDQRHAINAVQVCDERFGICAVKRIHFVRCAEKFLTDGNNNLGNRTLDQLLLEGVGKDFVADQFIVFLT